MGNGGILGVRNATSLSSASGIWGLREQLAATNVGSWPTYSFNVQMTGLAQSTSVNTFNQHDVTNETTPLLGGWYDTQVAGVKMYGFNAARCTRISVVATQAMGSAGNTNGTTLISAGGDIYYVTAELTVPVGTWIYCLAGSAGYGPTTTGSADGNAGGGGGATQIYVSATGGNFTINGMACTPVLTLNGSGGGNDAVFQGVGVNGLSYPNLVSSSAWAAYTANGTTFTKSGTTYGGFPGGATGDTLRTAGGGPGTNNYDATYISNQVIALNVSGSISQSTPYAGTISLANIN